MDPQSVPELYIINVRTVSQQTSRMVLSSLLDYDCKNCWRDNTWIYQSCPVPERVKERATVEIHPFPPPPFALSAESVVGWIVSSWLVQPNVPEKKKLVIVGMVMGPFLWD